MAYLSSTNKVTWLIKIFLGLHLLPKEQRVIYVDKKSAIPMAKNLGEHGRKKHINTRFHALRDAGKDGEAILVLFITENQ